MSVLHNQSHETNYSSFLSAAAGWGSPPLFKQTPMMVAVLTLAYLVVFVLAVVNNCLVVSAIVRNLQLRTITNYFLANLAVADILVSFIVLPITLLSNLFSEWLFGPFLCKITGYLQAVTVGASVNTLATVAVERYLAIFYPHANIIRPNTAAILIAIIWLVPVCIQVPWAVFYRLEQFPVPDTEHIHRICYAKFPSKQIEKGFFVGGVFLTCYIAPLCVIIIFYSLIGVRVWRRTVSGIKGSKAERNINRAKIRVVRMLIVVAVVFAFFWMPLYATRIHVMFAPKMEEEQLSLVKNTIVPIAQWLGAATSCVNPFIYCYFSLQFRKSIVAMLKNGTCCGRINV
ncbi:hypothetical protein CAPTEDRAFT_225192 [Capitella teleta]|uniref:G-protein coupled receptors family 1 profile domain-containing protein n=1 Tax=Capitella teleta TaxID=283909 RepID=R7VDV8_CAPTE|nr:hypothetical protein CAPTEDRAFT_225192 [Capitella teleta]|eukprot:ELU16809.1 hypothetical protein CAPTEDRAFT_225192 [Capitella teleta]